MANRITTRELVIRLEEQVKNLTLIIRDEVETTKQLCGDLHKLDLKIVPINGLNKRINTISNRLWGLLVSTFLSLLGLVGWFLRNK